MYYKLQNTIGKEVVVDGQTLVIGDIYKNKTKSPKNVDYVLAFSKSGDNWRFDGKADLDYQEFCELPLNEIQPLAWKSAKINIQALLRPKSSTKKQTMIEDLAGLKTKFDAGEIDATEFASLTMQIVQR